MKNIHILPTDKPSRLIHYLKDNSWDLFNSPMPKIDNVICQNIYIINSEEIKEGERGLSINNAVYTHLNHLGKDYGKKIILTTDQDLIKDGIQAIDDEFLEWFVKNPNCESVEVKRIFLGNSFVHIGKTPSKKEKLRGCYDNVEQIFGKWEELFTYEIIIPKEELCSLCSANKLIDGVCKECTELLCKPFSVLEKTETPEEAAERIYLSYENNELLYGHSEDLQLAYKAGVVDGAQWQAERMYSEEDMFDCWEASHTGGLDDKSLRAHFNHWFKKFKKK